MPLIALIAASMPSPYIQIRGETPTVCILFHSGKNLVPVQILRPPYNR